MKKYLLGISITVNILLFAALITVLIMFFNIKNTVNNAIDQVKSGEYVELVKQNIPDSISQLQNLKSIDFGDDPCNYFYQTADSVIGFLQQNSEIIGAELYVEQLSTLKRVIEKTPSTFKQSACKKAASGMNYIIDTIATNQD